MTIAATLVSHPDRPSAASGIDARVRRESGTLVFHFVLHAPADRIRIPPAAAGGRADGLCQHTCFEAFVRAGGTAYLELNFSPSGQWAIYRFSGYRAGMTPVPVATAPRIAVRRFDDRLELEAAVPADALDAAPAEGAQLALSAVVEDDSGRLSYWAVRHAPAQADFHHPDGFVLELPP